MSLISLKQIQNGLWIKEQLDAILVKYPASKVEISEGLYLPEKLSTIEGSIATNAQGLVTLRSDVESYVNEIYGFASEEDRKSISEIYTELTLSIAGVSEAAQKAQQAADAAQEAADRAQETADQAVEDAAAAQSTADQGVEEARLAQAAADKAQGEVDALEGVVEGYKTSNDARVEAVEGRVKVTEEDIVTIKSRLDNKNENTKVFETMGEFESYAQSATPKAGDLVFVVEDKKAFIFKGENAVKTVEAPMGWVLFDEISTELDLVEYLKVEEAASTYRRIDTKIASNDLDEDLTSTIEAKAEKTEVQALESTLNTKVSELTAKDTELAGLIASEVSERKSEVTRLDGEVTKLVAEDLRLTGEVARLDGEVERLDGEIEGLKEKDVELVGEIARVDGEIDALEEELSKVKAVAEYEEEFQPTAGQTTFSLTHEGAKHVKMYVNGVKYGSKCFSVVGTTVNVDNSKLGFALEIGDEVVMVYNA